MTLLISDRFYGDPRVLMTGDRAIGCWVRMLSWLAQWPDEEFFPTAGLRMFGVTKATIAKLIRADLLAETPGGWRPLAEGDLWRFARTETRAKIPATIRALVMERDEYRCQQCSATDDLTLDHITPWSHGGSDSADNLRVLCRPCNSSRGNRVETVHG